LTGPSPPLKEPRARPPLLASPNGQRWPASPLSPISFSFMRFFCPSLYWFSSHFTLSLWDLISWVQHGGPRPTAHGRPLPTCLLPTPSIGFFCFPGFPPPFIEDFSVPRVAPPFPKTPLVFLFFLVLWVTPTNSYFALGPSVLDFPCALCFNRSFLSVERVLLLIPTLVVFFSPLEF